MAPLCIYYTCYKCIYYIYIYMHSWITSRNIYLCIWLCRVLVGACGFHCSTQASPQAPGHRLSSCGTRASPPAPALQLWRTGLSSSSGSPAVAHGPLLQLRGTGSPAMAQGLCCPTACGILVPQPGNQTSIPCILEGRFLTTREVPKTESLCCTPKTNTTL